MTTNNIAQLEDSAARMQEKIVTLSPPKADGDARDIPWDSMTPEQRKQASRRKDVEANLSVVQAQVREHYASIVLAKFKETLPRVPLEKLKSMASSEFVF